MPASCNAQHLQTVGQLDRTMYVCWQGTHQTLQKVRFIFLERRFALLTAARQGGDRLVPRTDAATLPSIHPERQNGTSFTCRAYACAVHQATRHPLGGGTQQPGMQHGRAAVRWH